MRIEQLIKRYQDIHGERNFTLRNVDDLLYVHQVDYKLVEGLETLTQTNKEIFKTFLVNFYNGWGLTSQSMLLPMSVYAVLKRWHWIDILEKGEEDSSRVWIKEEHIALDSNGTELFKIRETVEEKYLSLLHQAEKEETIYLRFDYKRNNRDEWVHITQEGQEWY